MKKFTVFVMLGVMFLVGGVVGSTLFSQGGGLTSRVVPTTGTVRTVRLRTRLAISESYQAVRTGPELAGKHQPRFKSVPDLGTDPLARIS